MSEQHPVDEIESIYSLARTIGNAIEAVLGGTVPFVLIYKPKDESPGICSNINADYIEVLMSLGILEWKHRQEQAWFVDKES